MTQACNVVMKYMSMVSFITSNGKKIKENTHPDRLKRKLRNGANTVQSPDSCKSERKPGIDK